MSAMTMLKAEMIDRQIREKIRKHRDVTETCLHIGHNKYAKCAHNSLKLGRSKDEELEAEV